MSPLSAVCALVALTARLCAAPQAAHGRTPPVPTEVNAHTTAPAGEGDALIVPGDFESIQAAIDAAGDGTLVLVHPGVYRENLHFRGRAVEVRSVKGPQLTIIDGGLDAPVAVFDQGEGVDAVLAGFTIRNGLAEGDFGGGGVRCIAASPTIVGNIIVSNLSATSGGGIYSVQDASPKIVGNRIAGNTAESGGGIFILGNDQTPLVEANVIADNVAGRSGGGLMSRNASPTIRGNVISGNDAGDSGGGLHILYTGSPPTAICENIVSGNVALNLGGGMALVETGVMQVLNNLVVDNNAFAGGAVWATGEMVFVNNTVVRNRAFLRGGAFYCDDPVASISIANAIVRDNLASVAPEFSVPVFGVVTVRYSNIEGTWPGIGNIDREPGFVDAAGGGFQLAEGSPCIDAGDSTLGVLEGIARDLAGQPRFVDDPATEDTGLPAGIGAVIDMGAFEFQGDSPDCGADIDGSGDVGIGDLISILLAWGPCHGCPEDIDGSGAVDAGELLAVLSHWGPCLLERRE